MKGDPKDQRTESEGTWDCISIRITSQLCSSASDRKEFLRLLSMPAFVHPRVPDKSQGSNEAWSLRS